MKTEPSGLVLHPGDRVTITGQTVSYAVHTEGHYDRAGRYVSEPPTERKLERVSVDGSVTQGHDDAELDSVECMVLGWTTMNEGKIYADDDNQRYFYSTRRIKVWVVMPLTHDRYRKPIRCAEDQIKTGQNEQQ